ncbi:MAG: M23 family metallopeptidase [Fusicatenibacter sp.]|nr:M23 family metallopeptidase [Lachnospiraceae bacterium]MDY2939207.1 M23 family metallopeptidase [Fusicatenibacter sp.]
MRKDRKMTALFLSCILCGFLLRLISVNCIRNQLSEKTIETEAFRKLDYSEETLEKIWLFAQENQLSGSEILAQELILSGCILDDFNPPSIQTIEKRRNLFLFCDRRAYESVVRACRAIWEDLVCFPVAGFSKEDSTFTFEDTWMDSRNYGGNRGHEGCDIFGTNNACGYYPVISVCEGYVEQIGWLPMGGWRIGIRGKSGGYFYYAHLSEYGKDFQIGDSVMAGQLLGFMGNSGYGEEGTTGQFPVHLHFGCYIRSRDGGEISVNPYPMLCVLSKNIKYYTDERSRIQQEIKGVWKYGYTVVA